jgi:phosphatidate cytidylyltransferase
LLATVILAVLEGEPRASIVRIGSALLGIVVVAWTLAHLLVLRNYSDGVTLVLLLSTLTALNDVFAYIAGRLWGRRQLAAKISPSKTVEGWLGGAAGTMLLAALLCSWLNLPPLHALTLGGGVACLGVLGDLAISLFKRDMEVKDTGTLIAGHGGLLDRLDSLLFVAPFSVYILQLFPLTSGA